MNIRNECQFQSSVSPFLLKSMRRRSARGGFLGGELVVVGSGVMMLGTSGIVGIGSTSVLF